MADTEPQKYIYDHLDRQLISLLRKDGRAPVAKLAKILGVTRTTIQTRLDRLLNSGTLLGFTARVREDYEEDQIRAIMMIEVVGKTNTEVIRSLRGLPELHALHTTNGNWDLVAEIRVRNLQEFERMLREVRGIDGVANSQTSLLLSSV